MAAKKEQTNGAKKNTGIMLSIPDDVKKALLEAKAKAELSLGVELSPQKVIVGLLKRQLGLMK